MKTTRLKKGEGNRITRVYIYFKNGKKSNHLVLIQQIFVWYKPSNLTTQMRKSTINQDRYQSNQMNGIFVPKSILILKILRPNE